ncbi:MAG: hypothetical protein K5851_09005 [Lachnospiraceae bacterium]|nr:hypothetical protein [Lachnospiraceae bacterium]
MKRKICVISAVLVVLIFAVSFITYYPVRTFIEAKILLTDDIKKERSKNSLTEFNAKRVRVGGTEICFEESVYSKNRASELVNQIRNDLVKLYRISGNKIKISIYIVPNSWNKIEENKKELYVNEEEVESGDYLVYLTECTGIMEGYWKGLALESIIRNEPIGKKNVSVDLKTKASDVLSPFELLTTLKKSNDDNVYIAKQYGQWIYKKYGWDRLCEDKGKLFNRFSKNTEKEDNLTKGEQALFRFNLAHKEDLRIYNKEFQLNYPSNYEIDKNDETKIWSEVLDYHTELKNLLSKDYPKLKSVIEKTSRIRIEHIPTGDISKTYEDRIVLVPNAGPDTISHELTHFYTCNNKSREEKRWLYEGMAEYYSLQVEKKIKKLTVDDKVDYWYFRKEDKIEKHSDEGEFLALIKKAYKNISNNNLNYKNYNQYDFQKVCALVTLKDEKWKTIPEVPSRYVYSLGEVATGNKSENDLNNLTYAEAMLMYEYLVKTYDKKMLYELFSTNCSTDKIIGISEAKLKDEFLKWVNKNY